MKSTLNSNIEIVESARKIHSKASEEYVHVVFSYAESKWDGWVPVKYRRTGVSIEDNDTETLHKYLNIVYQQMNHKNFHDWQEKQNAFWDEKQRATTTKPFYDELIKGGWKCVECDLPKNPNWARRIQDLKEFGYTLATNTKRYCPNCQANKTHIVLLPIERGGGDGNGYEAWSPGLRKRIISVLECVDIYENTNSPHCLPDHKFPEIRWDKNTKTENSEYMTDEEIRQKFQLLTNQRNLQKREVCRTCFQTGARGIMFGIPFFYEGTPKWDTEISQTGAEAKAGCLGCPWYDVELWRDKLIEKLKSG